MTCLQTPENYNATGPADVYFKTVRISDPTPVMTALGVGSGDLLYVGAVTPGHAACLVNGEVVEFSLDQLNGSIITEVRASDVYRELGISVESTIFGKMRSNHR